ncbi:hypothetical protein [Argonema antarcticum]|uniref:hypothetical protein n=1 Tax=Argonema antarcticum TaxID=2942763 RepID=UPI002011B175|nr:hypothetical protein [Argonema antarcticum]MCL1472854.1 hypothetical protein [Argonema antarcticum A004/B2]
MKSVETRPVQKEAVLAIDRILAEQNRLLQAQRSSIYRKGLQRLPTSTLLRFSA